MDDHRARPMKPPALSCLSLLAATVVLAACQPAPEQEKSASGGVQNFDLDPGAAAKTVDGTVVISADGFTRRSGALRTSARFAEPRKAALAALGVEGLAPFAAERCVGGPMTGVDAGGLRLLFRNDVFRGLSAARPARAETSEGIALGMDGRRLSELANRQDGAAGSDGPAIELNGVTLSIGFEGTVSALSAGDSCKRP